MTNMTRLTAYLSTILIVSGCAFQTLDEKLPQFVGKKIFVVADYYGAPTDKKEFGGKKYYSWHRAVSGTTVNLQTTNSDGMIGGNTYYGSSQTLVQTPYTHSCKITFVTDLKDTVQSFSYEGNQAGCKPYADKLKETAKQ